MFTSRNRSQNAFGPSTDTVGTLSGSACRVLVRAPPGRRASGEIDTDTLDYTEVHDGAPPAPLMAQTMAAVKATTKPGPDCRYRRDGLCNCPDGECFADEVGIDNGTGDSDA